MTSASSHHDLAGQLMRRGYQKRKRASAIEKALAQAVIHQSSSRTLDRRTLNKYISCHPPDPRDNLKLWIQIAIQNGKRARGLVPGDEPAPFAPSRVIASGRGTSSREMRDLLERTMTEQIESVGLSREYAPMLMLNVQNFVAWISILPDISLLMRLILRSSNETTQFDAMKQWLVDPITMCAFFRTGNALINGADNLADTALALHSVLFRLWRKTGILPYYRNIRSENLTASVSTHCPIDLWKLKAELDKLNGTGQALSGFRVKYQPNKFPGLSLVAARATVLSAKGKPRKVSYKFFQAGKATIVGPRSYDDLLFNLQATAQVIALVLNIFRERPGVLREDESE